MCEPVGSESRPAGGGRDHTAIAPPPKLDPETLAIRNRPPRAIRFKRCVIIAIAAIGSVSLVAVTWMALKPRLFHRSNAQEALSRPNVRPTNDALSGAPPTYSDVPRPGPSLPGDLGKPILEHQQATIASGEPSGPLRQAQKADRESQFTDLKAARESGGLMQNRQGSTTTEPAITGTPAYQFTPSGMLSLTLAPVWGSGLQGTWTDTKARMIELRLGEVMLGLRKLTVWRRADQAKEAARQVRFDAEQRKRAALRASVEAEKVRIERLEADAAAWRRAEIIRGYAAARAAAGDPRSDPDLEQWLGWATDQADRVDPLRPTPSSILDTPEADITPLSFWNFPTD